MDAPARGEPLAAWVLDEVATAGRENLDVDHVAHYDDKEDANGAGEVALLLDLGLDQGSEVVDLGAGTGQFALAVAAVCARVVAVDVSPVMLARLRTKVAASALMNVEVVQGGFLTYEHRAFTSSPPSTRPTGSSPSTSPERSESTPTA